MSTFSLFQIQFVLSLILYALLAKWYVWPKLTQLPLREALQPPLIPHLFRHIGLLSLNPIVVDPQLTQTTFALHQAYGDLLAMILALLSLGTLRQQWRGALVLIWIFNIVGTIDLLEAIYNGISSQVYNLNMFTFWLVPTFVVPLLLVTHFMMYVLLLKR
jgi:hypothetical protein